MAEEKSMSNLSVKEENSRFNDQKETDDIQSSLVTDQSSASQNTLSGTLCMDDQNYLKEELDLVDVTRNESSENVGTTSFHCVYIKEERFTIEDKELNEEEHVDQRSKLDECLDFSVHEPLPSVFINEDLLDENVSDPNNLQKVQPNPSLISYGESDRIKSMEEVSEERLDPSLFTNNLKISDIEANQGQLCTKKPKHRSFVSPSPQESGQNICKRKRSTHQDSKQSNPTTTSIEPLFSCNDCDYRSSRKEYLARHISSQHGEKPLACCYCDFRTNAKEHLKRHVMIHTGEKPFSCSLCDYRCVSKGALNKHTTTHIVDHPFRCNICNYSTARMLLFAKHMKHHSGEKPYNCSECDFRATEKHYLKKHMLTHSGDKRFGCSMCDYKAVRKSDLISHLRIHTGEKLYSCSMCDYKASWKTRLNSHMRIHTGDKPFSCSMCSYKAAQKASLTLHMKVHLGDKTYSCSVCNYTCLSKGFLTKHMKYHVSDHDQYSSLADIREFPAEPSSDCSNDYSARIEIIENKVSQETLDLLSKFNETKFDIKPDRDWCTIGDVLSHVNNNWKKFEWLINTNHDF